MNQLYPLKHVDTKSPILHCFLNLVSYDPCFTATGKSLWYV